MEQNNYLDDMLLDFSNNSIPLENKEQLLKMEFLTIEQIFDQFPEIRTEFNWSKEDLEMLLESKLLLGKVEKTNVFISKSSLKQLIEYRNNVK